MGSINLNGVDVKIALTPVTSTILRISVYPAAEEAASSVLLDGPDMKPRDWEEPAAIVTDTDNGVLHVGEFTVSTEGDPMTVTITRNGRTVQRLMFDGDMTRFDMLTSRLYGLGHGFHSPMNRRGSIYDMAVNGQIRGIVDNYSATSAIPYLIGTGGWGLFFHMPWKSVFNLNGISHSSIRLKIPVGSCRVSRPLYRPFLIS